MVKSLENWQKNSLLIQEVQKGMATWAILVTNSDKIMKNALWFANHHRIGTPEREYIAKSISEFIDNKMRK